MSKRFTISLPDEVADWVEGEATRRATPVLEYMRTTFVNERVAHLDKQKPVPVVKVRGPTAVERNRELRVEQERVNDLKYFRTRDGRFVMKSGTMNPRTGRGERETWEDAIRRFMRAARIDAVPGLLRDRINVYAEHGDEMPPLRGFDPDDLPPPEDEA